MAESTTSAFEESTVAWYVNWLAENRPDIDEAQRLELATEFVVLQRPVQQTTDDDDDVLPDGQTVGNLLASERSEQRKRARLTKSELERITGTKL